MLLLSHSLTQAGIIVTIQTQMLTSNSVATTTIPCALLSSGMMLELLGALLIVGFLYISHHSGDGQSSRPSTSRNCCTLRVPAMLILTGIAELAAVLVIEMFKV